jgi:hypothetical protein
MPARRARHLVDGATAEVLALLLYYVGERPV